MAQRTVTGVVTDVGNQPITGVSVVVKGTSVGVVTSLNGGYTLNVPEEANTLLFSFIGYKTREVEIGNQSVINAVLEEELKALDEVVVVGYGVQRKSELTGASVSV